MKLFHLPHFVKGLFLALRLHVIFRFFKYPLLWLAYISEVSHFAWRNRHKGYNDFFNPVRNYEGRYALYDEVIQRQQLQTKYVIYLEFGVSKGHSLRYWSQKLDNPMTRFVGFDTFKGLPEAWGSYRMGDMRAGMQEIATDDARVHLVKGLFQESLPGWLAEHDISTYDMRVIHLDADLYSSTLYVLTAIFPHLKAGDIILFDEFNVPLHEFKAFDDFCKSYYTEFELIGSVNNYFQSAFVYRGQRLPEL